MKTLSIALMCLVCGIATAQQSLKKFQSVSAITSVGTNAFFSATDNENGQELWVSNGSPDGTFMVKDINPGYAGSAPARLTPFKGKLFFAAYTPQFGSELWVSDGTTAGSVMVKDLEPNSASSDPRELRVFKDHLYFITSQGNLYKSDGTAGGTTLLGPGLAIHVGADFLYYITGDPNEFKRTNGTTVTTLPFPDTEDDRYFSSFYTVADKLFALMASSYQQIIELYVYDENSTSWKLVKDFQAPVYGEHQIGNFTAVGTQLFFTLRTGYENEQPADQLWVSDGTTNGTIKLRSSPWQYYTAGSAMDHFIGYKNALYFRSGNSDGNALWKSDGTPAGTVKIHEVKVSSTYPYLTPPAISNDLLWFCGGSGPYTPDTELWYSDGTTEGTKLYSDLNQNGSSNPTLLTNINDKILYFVIADDSYSVTLWNTSPASRIVVETSYGVPVVNGSVWNGLSDGQAIGCISVPLVIHNIGHKELVLSDAVITGKDFYLKGDLPEFLAPGEKHSFTLYFMPLTPGPKTGDLFIRSNDPTIPRYLIKFGGQMHETQMGKICKAFDQDMVKALNAISPAKSISLSKTTVEEKLPSLTPVGTLSLPGFSGPVTYTLISGSGDANNNDFQIQGNQLIAAKTFDYTAKNLYTVRIKATTAESSKEEAFVIGIINKATPFVAEDCKTALEFMNYVLTDTEFNSAGELFAVTHDGRILRSLDEGVSWEFLNSGNWGQLLKIYFKGNTGYITGDHVLLKSTDNGATWFQLYLPFENNYVNQVTAFFLDASRGYVTGGDGYFFYTADGGKSWDLRLKGYYSEGLHDPWFFDENNGFAFAGGTILKKTINGGRDWEVVNVGTTPTFAHWTSLYFLNDKDGFLTSFYNMYRTKDGGKTWTGVPEVSPEYVVGIEFSDDKRGYIYGGAFFYTTADGGNSWEMMGYAGYGQVMGIAISDAGKLITVHRSSNGLGRSINFSEDHASTWNVLDQLPTADFNKVDFVTENVGYLLSPSGQFKTVDKGMTWKPFERSQPIYSFHYFDENNALLSDGYIIYKTSDGGVTLNEVLVTTGNPDPYYAPAGQLYAVTNDLIFSYSDYSIYRSVNAGDTWQLMGYDYAFYARDMQFLSATVGYRMELFGGVVKTVNGGTTWNEIYVNDPLASDPYHSIFFVNETIGYKGGRKFSKSIDGGVTWTTIYTNFYGDIFDLYFTDLLHGYAATRSRNLYETFDGGVTWSEIGIGGSNQDGLYSVQYKHGNIYLAGSGGYVAQLSNPGKKPLQAGYVVGPQTVCAGDTHPYLLSDNFSGTYQWNVPGAAISDEGSRAYVQFPHAGEYTFTINNSNTCGVSEPRTQTVIAVELPAPNLTGADLVESLTPVRYEVSNSEDGLHYLWNVIGAKTFTNEDVPYSTVTWKLESPEDASVQVFVTDPKSGCSVSGTLEVTLELALGIEEEGDDVITVYPNPTPAEVTIKSRVNEPLSITLYNSTGMEYFTNELTPSVESKLQLQHLPAGLYYLEITNSKGNKITKKILKQ